MDKQFNLEFLLVNFHDNDYYLPMCRTAETLLELFQQDSISPSYHLENMKNSIPRLMSVYNHLLDSHTGEPKTALTHLDEYFSTGTTYITDLNDIRDYISHTAFEDSLKETSLYDDTLLNDNPLLWLEQLNVSMDAETILLVFVRDIHTNQPVKELSWYGVF